MKKLIISVILVFVYVCCLTVTAFAAQGGALEKSEPSETDAAQLCFNGVETSAEAAVLYCVNDGKVYYSNNENKQMKNASTTKILTSLIALEQAQVENKQVEFTQEMQAEGSSMYLKPGDVLTLRDLAAGMMICSGNDAANAAALAVSGSFDGFAELMNRRAGELGMKNSHFVTPNGLDDPEHYSTAYDLALCMAYAMENSEFAEITASKQMSIDFVAPAGKTMTYSNHNRLLSSYEYCIGGKTGYTKSAGRCLVTAAEKDGLRFVCVTLNDKNDWKDHTKLYDLVFENFSLCSCDGREFFVELPVVGGACDTVTAGCDRGYGIVLTTEQAESVQKTVYLDCFYYAPVNEGDFLGKVVFKSNGKLIAEVPMTAMTESLKE